MKTLSKRELKTLLHLEAIRKMDRNAYNTILQKAGKDPQKIAGLSGLGWWGNDLWDGLKSAVSAVLKPMVDVVTLKPLTNPSQFAKDFSSQFTAAGDLVQVLNEPIVSVLAAPIPSDTRKDLAEFEAAHREEIKIAAAIAAVAVGAYAFGPQIMAGFSTTGTAAAPVVGTSSYTSAMGFATPTAAEAAALSAGTAGTTTAGALSTMTTTAGGVITPANNAGVDAGKKAVDNVVKNAASALTPEALGAQLGNKGVEMIKAIGSAKIAEIIAKYPNAANNPEDLSKLTAEIKNAYDLAIRGNASTGVNAALAQNIIAEIVNPKNFATVVAIAGALFWMIKK